MSSSKVFKQDTLFTPIPLVQRSIDLPVKKTKPAASSISSQRQKNPEPPPEPTIMPPPDPLPPVAEPEPASPVNQAPPIDVEAIRKEGYEQGMADLRTQLQSEFQQTMAAFALSCQQIDGQRQKLLQGNREDIINLIITLSKKILGQELATPRNIIATTLQAALEQAIESEEFYVTVHPEDLRFAEEKAPDLIAAIRGLKHLVFKTDISLTRGGALLESTVCSVDATIETQLESLKEHLNEHSEFFPDDDTADHHS
jgi:flagellar assembly protein FliH